MALKDKVKNKAYHQDYYQKNLPHFKRKSKEYRLKNLDDIKLNHKEYYLENREKILSKNREWKKQNKEKLVGYVLQTIEKWKPFFPEIISCEICGKELVFYSGDINKTVHFDHKFYPHPLKLSPSTWLRSNTPTPEKVALFNSFNFGRLCSSCNPRIPTATREAFIFGLVRYMYGQEVLNVLKKAIGKEVI